VADPVGFVTEVDERFFDRRNRLRMIEFRRLFLSISFGEVIVPEVVCYADFHVFAFIPILAMKEEVCTPRSGKETRGAGSQWMTLSVEGQSGYRKIFPS
jgi:hypothetical protein